MSTKKRKKAKKSVDYGKMLVTLITSLIIIVLIAAAATIYFNQEEQIMRIQQKAKGLEEQVLEAQEEKEKEAELVKRIDSIEYIEKIAREKLGMVMPGETLFVD